MIQIKESFDDVRKAIEDAGISTSEQGVRSLRKILVAKKDLDKATEIKNKIDSSVTVATRA